eukprot:scaffold42357_cov250-Skeletonema_dohrnii-CCMP3373.AAC.1
MDDDQKKLWMGIKAEIREKLLTCLLEKSSPPTPSNHRLPRTGVASRRARASNAAETELDDTIPEDIPTREAGMTYIQSMQARSKESAESSLKPPHRPVLHNKDALTPGRLMSLQNKSPHQLEPIRRVGANPTDKIPLRNASVAVSTPPSHDINLLTP